MLLVSGFIDLDYDAQTSERRPSSFYIDHIRRVLELPMEKVVFLQRSLINTYNLQHDSIVPFEKEELALWPLREKLLKCNRPVGINKTKDTADYFILMHQKVHWCLQAADLFPDRTYMWLDAGFNYICEKYNQPLADLTFDNSRLRPNTIRIPGCWKLVKTDERPTGLTWYFCGGLFAGDGQAIQRFRDLQNEAVAKQIECGVFTFEVTTWFHIACEDPGLFDWYESGHTPDMIKGF